MKRILVTGGAGFIGSHLCRYLLEQGNEVICMDNYFSGQKRNIHPLLPNPRFEAIQWDVTREYKIIVDEIYNLACPASPIHYQRFPTETINTNVIGMRNALDLATLTNAKVLQASTSEVYGDPEEHPQAEWYWGNVNPVGIRSCYDEGKRCAETMCNDYNRQFGTRVKIARIFNTYGPNMAINDGRVISNFIIQALQGRPITIYGSGSQTRSFQYIDDLILGLVTLMDTHDTITGPFNIGNPNEFAIDELAETIIALTGTKSYIVHKELPADDPRQRQPDIGLFKALTGWEPKIQLEEGLRKTIDYFKQLPK
jgi:UDP-glucuronate decarboxylase